MTATCYTIQVIAPKPVIIIDNVKASLSLVEIGNTITLTALIVNTGLAQGTVVVTFMKGTTVVDTAPAFIVPAQKSITVTSSPIVITMEDGGKQLTFCASATCQEC
jgi:hypothetical protein